MRNVTVQVFSLLTEKESVFPSYLSSKPVGLFYLKFSSHKSLSEDYPVLLPHFAS
jgi:hypothetical protein